MNYIKKHKLTAFVILVYIIVIGFLYFIYKLFIGSSGLPVYGDRLDGIDNVPIKEETINKIVEEISANESVLKVTKPYLNGKILKVVVTVVDNAELAKMKELSNIVVNNLDNDQKAFYDIEFFINKRYNCTLTATGNVDEEGNFVEDVTVKFESDLSNNSFGIDYGMSTTENVEYNKENSIKVTEDGETIVYAITKDKASESKCSIKIVKTKSEGKIVKSTITSKVDRDFPTIGYLKAGSTAFSWAKTV